MCKSNSYVCNTSYHHFRYDTPHALTVHNNICHPSSNTIFNIGERVKVVFHARVLEGEIVEFKERTGKYHVKYTDGSLQWIDPDKLSIESIESGDKIIHQEDLEHFKEIYNVTQHDLSIYSEELKNYNKNILLSYLSANGISKGDNVYIDTGFEVQPGKLLGLDLKRTQFFVQVGNKSETVFMNQVFKNKKVYQKNNINNKSDNKTHAVKRHYYLVKDSKRVNTSISDDEEDLFKIKTESTNINSPKSPKPEEKEKVKVKINDKIEEKITSKHSRKNSNPRHLDVNVMSIEDNKQKNIEFQPEIINNNNIVELSDSSSTNTKDITSSRNKNKQTKNITEEKNSPRKRAYSDNEINSENDSVKNKKPRNRRSIDKNKNKNFDEKDADDDDEEEEISYGDESEDEFGNKVYYVDKILDKRVHHVYII